MMSLTNSLVLPKRPEILQALGNKLWLTTAAVASLYSFMSFSFLLTIVIRSARRGMPTNLRSFWSADTKLLIKSFSHSIASAVLDFLMLNFVELSRVLNNCQRREFYFDTLSFSV